MDQRKWIPVEIPQGRSMGLPGLASRCHWRTRIRGGVQEVCTEEKYRGQSPRLVWPDRLVDASNFQGDTSYYRLALWPPRKAPAELWTRAQPHISAILGADAPTREEFWYAVQLLMMTAPDQQLISYVRDIIDVIIRQLPEASLWVLETEERVHARFAAVRALFSTHEAPELLDRPRSEFGGFRAAQGLHPQVLFGFEMFVEPALMYPAPWVLGVMSTREGGLLVIMFGRPEAGRKNTVAAELLNLYAPRGLSKAEFTVEKQPQIDAYEAESLLRWWANRLNDLLALVLDPANFPDGRGFYDPRSHFGLILSLERLFAVIQGVLLHSRRDEYMRKVLFFDALDILKGLLRVDYPHLLSHRRVREAIEALEKTLPAEVAKILMPRMKRGANALLEMRKGFYLTERVSAGAVKVKGKGGDWVSFSFDRAVAEYLRVVRNSTHSFKKLMTRPVDLSLLASHDGELPVNLPDVALVHVLTILSNPRRLFPRL